MGDGQSRTRVPTAGRRGWTRVPRGQGDVRGGSPGVRGPERWRGRGHPGGDIRDGEGDPQFRISAPGAVFSVPAAGAPLPVPAAVAGCGARFPVPVPGPTAPGGAAPPRRT